MSKKIVVIGGSGFLGSHVADELTLLGYKVTILDKIKSKWSKSNQKFFLCDIFNKKLLKKYIKGAHAVFNYAAIADLKDTLSKPIETVNNNILSVVNLLEICKELKIKQFIHASTIYVSGNHGGFYKSSKLASESYIEEYNRIYGLNYTILRYGTLYGSRSDESNGLYQIVKNALKHNRIIFSGDPEAMRDYINVIDAAKASTKSLEKNFRNKKVIISGNETIKVRDLLAILSEMMNLKNKVKFVSKNKIKQHSHYVRTPYSINTNLVMRYNENFNIYIGQGLYNLIKEIKKD
jgi:UDP-glucose 4-epimerase